MRNISLRTKVLVLVVLITSIALSFVGYGNYLSAKHTVTEALIDKAYNRVQSSADNLSAWIRAKRSEVEVMSRTDIVRSGTDSGRLLYFSRETDRATSDFFSIGYAKPSGSALLSNGKTIDIREEPSLPIVMSGQTVITDPFRSQLTRNHIFVIQVPVYDNMQQIQGAVDAAILTERLYKEHLDIHVGSSEPAFLYTDKGAIAPRSAKEGEIQYLTSPTLPYNEISMEMIKEGNGYLAVYEKGSESLVFFAKVEGTSWHIAMKVPFHEIEQPLTLIKWRTTLFIALAEIIMIILFFLYSNHLVKRIKRILYVTEAASEGDFTGTVYSLPQGGNDELAQLAHSVNEMSVHLGDMFGRMEAIINQNQFAYIVLDENYRVTYFSRSAERMLGYKAEEVLHIATGLLFIDPDEIKKEARRLSIRRGYTVQPDTSVFKELQKESFTYEREWTYVRKDGMKFPVSFSSNGIRDSEGRFIGVTGIARDITLQKQAEKARNQQLEVLEAAKDLIATFNEQGELLYLNPAGRELLSTDAGHQNSAVLLPDQTIEELLHGIEDAKELGFQESEARLRTMDGKLIAVSKILVVHKDNQTGEAFYSCIARDISEQKRVQTELELAKLDAEDANMAKSQFLARMSHEIRTPLAGIIGLSGLMQKTELTDVQQDYLDKTRASSEALLLIINDILDFAKAEAGKIKLNHVSFSPYEMIHRLADLLTVFIGGKHEFEFIIKTPVNLPELLVGDSLRMEQILLNLCVNAIKFTDKGYVQLKLHVHEGSSAERARIDFVVEDTGIGMTENQQQRLFKPFMQVDDVGSRRFGGTGLGLVIVKSLVEMMGGSIDVSSQINVGSRFSFTLEFAVEAPAKQDRFRINQTGEMVVWVLEDSALLGEMLCTELEDMGLSPMSLSSWKITQERLSRVGIGGRPDVILLDFEMPDMFGEETWQNLHNTAKRTGIQTIALTTAYGREELLKLDESDRPDAILVKPMNRLSIYQGLAALVNRSGGHSSAMAEIAAGSLLDKPITGTILLAEDNKINQLVAVEQLREWGFAVEVAETGTQVLKKLEERRWDLILMDIHMPEMDGDEAARLIRSDSKYDRMPIVALTANIIREDHERYIQLGMNDVLTKPIEPDVMHEVIAKWLRSGSDHRMRTFANTEAARDAYEPIKTQEGHLPIDVPGMDAESALERVNGKRDILNHMIKLFIREYATFDKRLREAVKAEDQKLARRLAHTIKGVAGNLSASELASSADQLEGLLKLPKEEQDLSAIHEAVEQLLSILESMMAAFVKEETSFDSIS
ncbi:response regulator [Paenibacillus solisilvae]|uniref:histidine kinase n=1 Tax=Paenibacillus solisilvae TaxID=2486751 RepID=A0ABW0VZM8_9BACL